MGCFLDGYKMGQGLLSDEVKAGDITKTVEGLLKNNPYGECVEWYNGFYKGMLDHELFTLQKAFGIVKQAAEENSHGE